MIPLLTVLLIKPLRVVNVVFSTRFIFLYPPALYLLGAL